MASNESHFLNLSANLVNGLKAVACGLVVYTLYGAIWRLYLSPIAHIPGPRFAALTFWNEFYFDVLLGGKYTWKLLEYHRKYGPVIRINPYEVHINDPDFYDEVYVGSSKAKTEKWYWSMRMFGQQDVAAFDTLDHDKHRQRRYNLLDKPEFDSEHYEAWMSLSRVSHTLKQFGWLYPVLDAMPMWVTKYTSPAMYLVLQTQEVLLQQSIAISKQRDNPDYKESGRPSMIQAFMDSPTLPESEKRPARIKGEAQIAMGAGTVTTTHALKAATYHILANPPIRDKLMEELEAQIPDPASPPTLQQLEQMPYLMAVMHETFRIFYGNSHRLQRIFPTRVTQYKDLVIPPGTPISMSTIHIHDNERAFPEPRKCDPSRWQGPSPPFKYIVPFSRGSRQCVGMELAKAEFLTVMANVFRRFGREMELYNTVRERDIDTVYDVFNTLPSRQSNGLMVLIRKREGED